MKKYLATITTAHIGRRVIPSVCCECVRKNPIYIGTVIGYVQRQDVGKRVYDVDGVIQVENNEQRNRRIANETE